MKHLLLTTIAALLVVGCGESQQSVPAPEAKPLSEADSALLDAATEGDIEAVKQHLAAGANVNGAKEGYPPLNTAIFNNQLEVVKLLVSMGADVNRKNRHHPMVMTAVDKDHGLEILKFLLEKGADPNAKDYSGKTSLDKAVEYNYPEAAALLRKHGGESAAGDSIHIAADMGNLEAVKKHIAAGADVAHVAVSGIGEGAGNAPLEDVILSLKCLYGVDTRVKTEKFVETSKFICKMANDHPLPPNRPRPSPQRPERHPPRLYRFR